MEKKGFYWSEEREPHFDRRKEILEKHPEVRELYGIDKGLKYKSLGLVKLSHDLAFKKKSYNNWLAIITNIPIVAPYAISFKTYHLKHHWEQGDEKNDTDLPTEGEAKTFTGKIMKLLWATNQILFYAFRPMFVHKIKLEKWHYINIVFQLVAISVYTYFVGRPGNL